MSAPVRAGTRSAPPKRTRRVAVVCESTACLPRELVERYQIGIVPIPFVFGSETFRDGVELSPGEFYARLAASRTPPKTSPPAPGAYLAAWAEAARSAEAALLVTAAGKIATLQRSAALAKELASEQLPGLPVAIVDSGSAAMGQGFVALAAARAAQEGQPLEAVVERARAVSQRVELLVTLDTLAYLARAARMPRLASLVGGLLEIKPLIRFAGGEARLLARVRTRQRALDQLFDTIRRAVPSTARVHLAVHHARAVEEAARLAGRLREAFPHRPELYTTEFTPVMGGYCGPGLIGVAFYTEPEHGSPEQPGR